MRVWEHRGEPENLGRPGRIWEDLGESVRMWGNLVESGRVCESVLTTRATRAQQRGQELGKSWERAGGELGKSWARAGEELGPTRNQIWTNLGTALESKNEHFSCGVHQTPKIRQVFRQVFDPGESRTHSPPSDSLPYLASGLNETSSAGERFPSSARSPVRGNMLPTPSLRLPPYNSLRH